MLCCAIARNSAVVGCCQVTRCKLNSSRYTSLNAWWSGRYAKDLTAQVVEEIAFAEAWRWCDGEAYQRNSASLEWIFGKQFNPPSRSNVFVQNSGFDIQRIYFDVGTSSTHSSEVSGLLGACSLLAVPVLDGSNSLQQPATTVQLCTSMSK